MSFQEAATLVQRKKLLPSASAWKEVNDSALLVMENSWEDEQRPYKYFHDMKSQFVCKAEKSTKTNLISLWSSTCPSLSMAGWLLQ